MTDRRLLRWADVKDVMGFEAPAFTQRRRVERAADVVELRLLADRRAPRSVFDYVDGAAERESTMRRSRRLFRDLQFEANVLRDVGDVDPSTTLLGSASTLPFALSPTGFTRMMHTEGEPAVARAAADAGIPYSLSTLGTTSVEDLAAVATGTTWFQLYVSKDRGQAKELVDRVIASGYDALMLTVDTAVGGNRLRDVRNGLTIPPTLTAKTIVDGAVKPSWWFDLLTTAPLEFASLNRSEGTVAELLNRLFEPSLTMDDVRWLRDLWSGPLVVKGVQTVADAVAVVDAGADGVILSNHGGRQLDRGRVPLTLVQPTVEALEGRAEVYVDGGILSGADVVAAVALGANAAMAGRAYLYGLMAGGETGVRRMLALFDADIRRTMQLLGARTVADLTPDMVTLPQGSEAR